jgi:hypothetical protein
VTGVFGQDLVEALLITGLKQFLHLQQLSRRQQPVNKFLHHVLGLSAKEAVNRLTIL